MPRFNASVLAPLGIALLSTSACASRGVATPSGTQLASVQVEATFDGQTGVLCPTVGNLMGGDLINVTLDRKRPVHTAVLLVDDKNRVATLYATKTADQGVLQLPQEARSYSLRGEPGKKTLWFAASLAPIPDAVPEIAAVVDQVEGPGVLSPRGVVRRTRRCTLDLGADKDGVVLARFDFQHTQHGPTAAAAEAVRVSE